MVEAILASSQFGADAQVGSDKVLGQILDVAADPIGQCYETIQSLYDGFDPDGAIGTLLENIAGLTGLTRQVATYSTATLTLGGTPGTVIAAGKRSRVPDGGIFALNEDATIGVGGTVDAAATCTTAGAVEAAAGSITEIVDAVSGWTSVTNAAEATEGDPIETDTALRTRRESTFSAGGSCIPMSLAAALERLDFVTSANVISNDTSATVDGVPAHSFRTVIYPTITDADDLETIAQTIWLHKPAGIESYGTDKSATVTNAYDYSYTVKWDWATTLTMHANIAITVGSDYPATGDALVKAAIEAWGDALGLAGDAHNAGLIAAVMAAVPGIQVFTTAQVKEAAGAYANSYDVDSDEITSWDTANITVVST
jgi:hypothetical protein